MEILQVAQHADDLDRAAAFYENLLGGPPAGRFEPGLLFFNVGRSRLLLERAAASDLVYFEVDDLHGTLDRLRADGVEIVGEPHVIYSHTDDSLGPSLVWFIVFFVYSNSLLKMGSRVKLSEALRR